MKRILQSLKDGSTKIIETPVPKNKSKSLLIQTKLSLISPGTEKMLIDFGKASFIQKSRQQPDKVHDIYNKIKTDGFLATIDAVRTKLDQMIPLGYCNVGRVLEVGDEIREFFSVGDRVISNGAHAEIVSVPKNLCCKVPSNVSDEAAVFTVLGAIALQGIRLAQPTLGEYFVVIGLGLIGLLTVQLLRAHGCRVLGIDFDTKRCELAAQFGAEIVDLSLGEDPIESGDRFSRNLGVDAVLITASTKSNDPVHQAAHMCRKRGRIVLIGVTGLALSRSDFYEKELTFQVSCSYGPGRYDPTYEEEGCDYPYGFVRWTQQRNFEAFLEMLASNRVRVEPLISSRFSFEESERAYQDLNNKDTLGILLNYRNDPISYEHMIKINERSGKKVSKVCVGFIGSGNYASRVLIPAFKKANVNLKLIACNTGISGTHFGKKFGFERVTADVTNIFTDDEINTVVIATRHDTHAQLSLEALKAQKHVFIEKPLCITLTELDSLIYQIGHNNSSKVMVGFNRRFSPHIQKIKSLLKPIMEPKSFIMTVNAGEIPSKHWIQDSKVGGGRIIGEGCHFIDLLRYLAGAPITQFHITKMNNVSIKEDKSVITLSFADGSLGVIHYLANGNKAFPKERLEIFTSGKILQLDNFCKLRGYGWKSFKKMNLWRQDKGQMNCVREFVNMVVRDMPPIIPLNEILEVSRVSIQIVQ